MVALQITNRGRKARLGKVEFINGRLGFFLGYHSCSTCQSNNKIVIDVEEARRFARTIGISKVPIRKRIIRSLVRYAEGYEN